MAEKEIFDKKNKTMTGLELKWEILLVYLVSILGFIFTFIKDKNVSKEARFHYEQSGVIFLIIAAVGILYGMLNFVFAVFMFGLFPLISLSFGAIYTTIIVLLYAACLITIIRGFNGDKFEIPVISDIRKIIYK